MKSHDIEIWLQEMASLCNRKQVVGNSALQNNRYQEIATPFQSILDLD